MTTAKTTALVNCDICGDEMSEQSDGAFVCWRDQHRIPADQLYRYAEHITVEQRGRFDDCPF